MGEGCSEDEAAKRLHSKNVDLEKRLQDVYVTSETIRGQNVGEGTQSEKKIESSKPLPQLRRTIDFEYGFYEPNSVQVGKCTLREILFFLTKYKEDPENYNAKMIAGKYNLEERTVENILRYYFIPDITAPQENKEVAADADVAEAEIKYFNTSGNIRDLIQKLNKKNTKEPKKSEAKELLNDK